MSDENEAEIPNLALSTYLNPFTESVKVKRVEMAFLINVENVDNLGEALDKAAINLLRQGMDSYYIVATDLDTGTEFLVANGEVTLADQAELERLALSLREQEPEEEGTEDEPAT